MDDLYKKIESILIKEFDVDWDKIEERLKVVKAVKRIRNKCKNDKQTSTPRTS